MILIYSVFGDDSTNDVIDWIKYFNKDFIRINNRNINEYVTCFEVPNSSNSLIISGKVIKSIWYRRISSPKLPVLRKKMNSDTSISMTRHLSNELLSLNDIIYSLKGNIRWLSHPESSNLDKFKVLDIACQLGLKVPQTIVTNSKDKLLLFARKFRNIVIKNLNNATAFRIGDTYYSTYTAILNLNIIKSYNENIFPALYQEYIEKEFEIRTFFLNDSFFSMAIFSQQSVETKIDFRRYSKEPNRLVPFKLPNDIEDRLINLMKILNLNSGSIDIIKTKMDYVFLEVNPVGQFGMVSQPCNYYLEKKVAQFLCYEEESDF